VFGPMKNIKYHERQISEIFFLSPLFYLKSTSEKLCIRYLVSPNNPQTQSNAALIEAWNTISDEDFGLRKNETLLITPKPNLIQFSMRHGIPSPRKILV
jgi:hypothetical protein